MKALTDFNDIQLKIFVRHLHIEFIQNHSVNQTEKFVKLTKENINYY